MRKAQSLPVLRDQRCGCAVVGRGPVAPRLALVRRSVARRAVCQGAVSGIALVPTAEIPIRNVYYLLCYAWNQLQEGSVVDVSRLRSTELVDPFAFVLIGGINHVARRGLEQGYRLQEQEVVGLRGRIELVASARRMLRTHGRTLCSFDELSPNTLPNRILKATLRVLSAVPTINGDIRRRVVDTYRNLGGYSRY
jgi:5-methylcytosine-specific restriction enzyme subunit McrC